MRYKVKIVWKVIYYVHTEPSIGKYKLRIMNLNWSIRRRQVVDLYESLDVSSMHFEGYDDTSSSNYMCMISNIIEYRYMK